VKDDAYQGAVHGHSVAVVVDEAELAEAVEEEADPGAGGADHFGEGFLADLGDDWNGLRLLAEVGHEEQQAGEAFFTGVEELIDQVGFHAHVAGKEIGEKLLREFGFVVEQVDHDLSIDANDGALLQGTGTGHAQRLTGETAFPKETAFVEDSHDCLFAGGRYDGKFYLSALDEEDGIGWVALGEDSFVAQVGAPGFAGGDFGEEMAGIESNWLCCNAVWGVIFFRSPGLSSHVCGGRGDFWRGGGLGNSVPGDRARWSNHGEPSDREKHDGLQEV